MPTATLAHRLVATSALALALAACGGGTGTDLGDPAAQPTDGASATGDPGTSAMCVEDEPDCQDTVVTGDGGGAASSCLAGDPDCTDESFDGQDVTRPVPLSDEPLAGEPATDGATTGASGAELLGAHLLDDTTLQVEFLAGNCILVEDVLVTESPEEVRVLVLAGDDPAVEMCTQALQSWTTTVALDAPLADRTLLDLAG